MNRIIILLSCLALSGCPLDDDNFKGCKTKSVAGIDTTLTHESKKYHYDITGIRNNITISASEICSFSITGINNFVDIHSGNRITGIVEIDGTDNYVILPKDTDATIKNTGIGNTIVYE